MAISKNQPMRPALIDAIDAINEGTSGSGTVSVNAPLEIDSEGKIGLLYDPSSLSVDGQGQIGLLSTILDVIHEVPHIQFGTSNSITVGALQQASVDITFSSTTTEEPVIFVNLQHSGTYGDLTWYVRSVTNQQASITIVNNGSQDAEEVIVDWLAISGR